MSPSPKPLGKIGYCLLTTLWAFLVPGVIVHIVPSFLAALNWPGIHDKDAWIAWLLFIVCIGAILFCVWHFKRLSQNLRTAQVPGTFFQWIVPFWIPLYWGLAANACIAHYAAHTSFSSYYYNVFAFPQYSILLFITFLFGGTVFWIAASLIASLVIAILATCYVAAITPTGTKWKGCLLCCGIALLLGSMTYVAHREYRSVYLPHPGKQTVVRDERHRQPWGQDTDLSEYVPFSENNKLVKIESPTLTIDFEHPTINGATALYPVYAATAQAIYKNVDEKSFADYNDDIETYSHQRCLVNANTTPKAFEMLLAGSSDCLIMAMPSEKQLQSAKDKNCELVIMPLGYEAFVFFVNAANPVSDLSLEQIRHIYSKKITNWSEAGGKDERILPFQRPEGSGSQTAMLRLMGEVPMAVPMQEEFQLGMGGIIADVADYRNFGNALGFSFRYYVEGMFKHEGIKLLKVEGIAPTIENIQNGTYPLTGQFVFISRKDNRNINVDKLRDWFLSEQGQELIEKVGYVPLKR